MKIVGANALAEAMRLIKVALSGKSDITHTHLYAGSTSAGGAATKATQDSAGQQINTTYIKGLSVSGKTITYTKGNGTTGTITTQDTNTTYSAASTSAAGLMSAADKTKLNGIATGANAYSHPNSGVSAGTYTSVTVNAQGHITAGTNPASSSVSKVERTITLAVANWSSSNVQAVACTGVTTSNTIIVSPSAASHDGYNDAGIYCSAQASNSLTFKCSDKPSVAITVNVVIFT